MKRLRLEIPEPVLQSISRAIIEMPRRLVQRLQERCMNQYTATRSHYPKYLLNSLIWIAVMFESIKRDYCIERRIDKRQSMDIAYDIGMPKDRRLEFDDVFELLRGASSTQMQNHA